LIPVFGGGLGRRTGRLPEAGDGARPPPALCDEREGELPGARGPGHPGRDRQRGVLGFPGGPSWTGAGLSGEERPVFPDELQHQHLDHRCTWGTGDISVLMGFHFYFTR